MAVTSMTIPCLTIPCIVHGTLHELFMFHVTRKRGPHKHVMGMHCRFLMAPLVDMHGTVKI